MMSVQMTSAKSMTLSLLAVCTIGLSSAGLAADAYQAEASLAQAVQAATDTEVDGVNWRCEGDKCVGKAARRASLDSYMKECRKVAGALGKLTGFTSRGRAMSKRDLDNCNRAAK
jgi:hypothetical protein